MEFKPDSNEFFKGMPVSDVDPALKYVHVLSMADVPENVPDSDRPGSNGHYFHLLQDIDKDGVAEDINVGVYEVKSGEKGRFILISSHGEVEYFRKHPEGAKFSILAPGQDNTVFWAYCMNCDYFDTLRWNGKSIEIELYDGSAFH